jgi:hypothetical protein
VNVSTVFADHLLVEYDTPTLTGETASATFSTDLKYRYALTRTWMPGWPRVLFVMLNPSTADAFTNDPTIRRCMAFARSWQAGGITVVNLFALRSPDPRALRASADPVGPHNDAVIRNIAATETPGLTIAAWGAYEHLNGRDETVTGLLSARDGQVHALGTTKHGHPRHPLYLPKTAKAAPFAPPRESL